MIQRWMERADSTALIPALDAVFFETSAIKEFPSEAERATFRERWLGRYLEHDPSFVYVAMARSGALAGYLVGSLDDPAEAPRFGDLAYFRAFAPFTREHPAHLHVNLSAGFHGQGIGSGLVEAFARDAAEAGAPGMHVVTGKGMRNIAFYKRNGFRELGSTGWSGKEVVLLGRPLISVHARGLGSDPWV